MKYVQRITYKSDDEKYVSNDLIAEDVKDILRITLFKKSLIGCIHSVKLREVVHAKVYNNEASAKVLLKRQCRKLGVFFYDEIRRKK